MTGPVTLVGAGPGDPELLTLKALRAIRGASIILFDHLVSDEIMRLTPKSARCIWVGKIGHGPAAKQPEINALMIALAHAGHTVVRLKAGDPLIFARAGEEMEALSAAGIVCTIIPGISAYQAAAASLAVSLTHRKTAGRLQVVTGHSCKGGLPDDLDWNALTDPTATTAVYMGRRTAGQLTRRLLAAGRAATTPAAVVFDASRNSERVLFATLGDLPRVIAEEAGAAPCIILIGEILKTSPLCLPSHLKKTQASYA